MNRLPLAKRCQIIQLLVEGNSLRSCCRIANVSMNGVMRVFIEAGKACIKFHNETVINVEAKRVQCDEIWAFVYSKDKNTPEGKEGAGDVWTWTAIDADSKLIITWLVGNRDFDAAKCFMKDVAARLKNRVQLTTDGYRAYPDAINKAFDKDVNYGQIVKMYSRGKLRDAHPDKDNGKGYSKYIGSEKITMFGKPNPKFISTSFVERQNLSIRMGNRRFTRKTNAFSKKVENNCYSLALYFVYYNFVRIHKTLNVTPAMQAGLIKRFMKIEEIAKLAEAMWIAPQKRGHYKTKNRV